MRYFIYILTNSKNGTIYIDVTSNLIKIVSEHKEGLFEGFTKKYKVHNLVYYELTHDVTVWIPAAVYPHAGGDGNDIWEPGMTYYKKAFKATKN